MSSPLICLQTRDWLWRSWQIRYQFWVAGPEVKSPPILLLHGFGASCQHWRQNMAPLGSKHRLYALDLLGFGASEKAPVYYGQKLWVEQVYDFWRSFIGEPLVIVGNSLGALVGLQMAEQYPEVVKGLVAISLPDLSALEKAIPRPVRPIKQFLENTIGGLLAVPLFNLIRQRAVIRWVLGNFVYGTGAKEAVDEELVEIIASPARERQASIAFAFLNKGRASDEVPNAKKIIVGLKVPLLLLWGTNDRVIPPQIGKKLAPFSPLAELVLLPGLGHCPHDESPQQVNEIILQWIERSIV